MIKVPLLERLRFIFSNNLDEFFSLLKWGSKQGKRIWWDLLKNDYQKSN